MRLCCTREGGRTRVGCEGMLTDHTSPSSSPVDVPPSNVNSAMTASVVAGFSSGKRETERSPSTNCCASFLSIALRICSPRSSISDPFLLLGDRSPDAAETCELESVEALRGCVGLTDEAASARGPGSCKTLLPAALCSAGREADPHSSCSTEESVLRRDQVFEESVPGASGRLQTGGNHTSCSIFDMLRAFSDVTER